MYIYVSLYVSLSMAQVIITNNKIRCDKPHPIDLKELKKPLMQICLKEDRSIPYLVRKAVKEWLQNNYPETEVDNQNLRGILSRFDKGEQV